MARKKNKIKPNGVKLFKERNPEFLDKLTADKELLKNKKQEFIKHLKGYKSGCINGHALGFTRQNLYLGRLIKMGNDEMVGSVRAKDKFVEQVVSGLGIQSKYARAKLRGWVLLSSDELQAEFDGQLADSPVSRWMMWSYRNPNDSLNAFNGIDTKDLSCRLGLPNPTQEKIAFGHMLPVGHEAHAPTAFDSELFDQWIPGGVTKPHPPCLRKYKKGLPEIIHKPTPFRCISTKLVLL